MLYNSQLSYCPIHAGQLRFHDFPKLREIHRAKLAASASASAASTNHRISFSWNRNSSQQQQIRTYFSLTSSKLPLLQTLRNWPLKRLEREATSNLNDAAAQYAFVNALYENGYYDAVINYIRNKKKMAIDGNTAIVYLQCLQKQNQYQQLHTDDLLQRLKWTTGAEMPPELQEKVSKSSKMEKTNLLMSWLSGGSSSMHNNLAAAGVGVGAPAGIGRMAPAALMGGPGVGGGTSAKQPLHVQVLPQPHSTRQAIVNFMLRAGLVLVAVSAVSALMDERGLGRGGLGGMNSGSKHIQEADSANNKKVKFDDVKGVTEAKAELEEIVMYLKDPTRFTRLGGKLPRGLLLTGPPGTGKTLLAKAIAGEADVPFFYSSGSQFEEVYVGLGAKRIRELFEAAKKKAPAIIFIDEIDAVGGTRKLKDQSALKMTLNELLVQLDGFDENNGIIVIGATNFMESLDPALMRPGRFDKHVSVPLPDVGGRKEILEMYAKKTKLSPDVDLTVIARGTTGFSGADLSNLINQAAVKASVDGLPHITMQVMEYAKDKILMGAERKTAVITKETARCTAFHEAGHAVVAVLTDGAMPIHKATIMPRGEALGMVTMLPEGDQTSQSLKQMLAGMDVAMGGRVAEELIFGKDAVTSGASSDIRNASRIARSMVTKWGFSEEVGIVYHGGETGEESASAETRARIDTEVKRLTQDAYTRAKDLLTKYGHEHKMLAETLLEYETLTGDEVRDLVKKRIKPKRPVINKNGGQRGDASVFNDGKGGKQKGGRLFGKDSASSR